MAESGGEIDQSGSNGFFGACQCRSETRMVELPKKGGI